MSDEARAGTHPLVAVGVAVAHSKAGRHLAAVTRSLELADRAAARGDYVNALMWVSAAEAIGYEVSDEYKAKRIEWFGGLCSDPAASRATKTEGLGRLGRGPGGLTG